MPPLRGTGPSRPELPGEGDGGAGTAATRATTTGTAAGAERSGGAVVHAVVAVVTG